MYAISVILDIDPEHIEEFKAAALFHANSSKTQEPGCLGFEVFQSTERPDRFYFHEYYVDKAAVTEVHNKAPYKEAFGQKTGSWIKGKQIEHWNNVD
ncbi:MAG: antibiotic biosynthesis monooxygenase [Desulfovibrionaceae bacterium]|nr:antibiotic biosynthesis monooxygenase [Desulfovibrionaceae bacterium]